MISGMRCRWWSFSVIGGIYTKSWIDSWINHPISYFVGYSLVSNNNSLLSNKPTYQRKASCEQFWTEYVIALLVSINL